MFSLTMPPSGQRRGNDRPAAYDLARARRDGREHPELGRGEQGLARGRRPARPGRVEDQVGAAPAVTMRPRFASTSTRAISSFTSNGLGR